MTRSNQNDGYIVEMIKVGSYVKVSAICTRTGVEASIVGDPKASKKELENLAIQKLQFVLRKEQGKDASGASGGKKGIVV